MKKVGIRLGMDGQIIGISMGFSKQLKVFIHTDSVCSFVLGNVQNFTMLIGIILSDVPDEFMGFVHSSSHAFYQ